MTKIELLESKLRAMVKKVLSESKTIIPKDAGSGRLFIQTLGTKEGVRATIMQGDPGDGSGMEVTFTPKQWSMLKQFIQSIK